MYCRFFSIAFIWLIASISEANDEYEFASLVSKEKLVYPRDALINDWEGWAYYFYTIGIDGRPKDIQIIDSSGVEAINRALIRYIESHVYEPAKLNGRPVEDSSGIQRATFLISDLPRAADKGFYRRYNRAKSAAADGAFDKVKSILDDLEGISHKNLYEEMYLQSLYVAYYRGIGERHRAYLHAQRVIDFWDVDDPRFRLGEIDYFVPFMTIAYQYEVSQMLLGDALVTAALLAEVAPENEQSEKIALHSANLARQVEGKQFSMQANIVKPIYGGTRGRLVLHLLNKEIELSSLSGKIEGVRLFCEEGYRNLELKVGHSWKIPNHWGKCKLTVEGQVGSKFTLTEKPS